MPEEAHEEVDKLLDRHPRWKMISKLVVGITILSGGLNKYIELEEKNETAYQAISTKLNNLSSEVAEMRGQNRALLHFIRAGGGFGNGGADVEGDKAEEDDGSDEHGGIIEVDPEPAMDMDPPPPEEEIVHEEVAATRVKTERVIEVDAYQELPDNLNELVQQKRSGKILKERPIKKEPESWANPDQN